MKKTILLITVIITLSCSGGKPPELLTSIHPYTLLLRELAGDGIPIGNLIPANASPHTYAPTPNDLKKMQKARLILANGIGLERMLLRKMAQTKNRLLLAGDSIFSRNSNHHGTHKHHHDQETHDPHLWMHYGKIIQMAKRLTIRLGQLYPNRRARFQINLKTFLKKMAAADRTIRKERQLFENPGIVTFHDSFFHFRKRYGIKLVAVIAATPGRQPSSKELRAIGRQIRRNTVSTIFIEPQLNPKAAQVIAREYGLKVSVIDPLGATTGVRTIAEHYLKSWFIMKKSFRK